MNKEFQRDEVSFKKLMDVVTHCISELEQTYLDEDYTPGGYFFNAVQDAIQETKMPLKDALKSARLKHNEAAKSIQKLAAPEKSATRQEVKDSSSETTASVGTKRSVPQVHKFRFSDFPSQRAKHASGTSQSASGRDSPPPAPLNIDGVTKWEVEKIVDEDEELAKVKVRWRGYSEKDDSWEPETEINPIFIHQFRQSQMMQAREGIESRHTANADHVFIYNYRGVDVTIRRGDEQYVIDGIREYARDVIDGLKERFPDKSGQVLSAFDIFHLDSMPSDTVEWDQKRETYGVDDLSILIRHYFPCVDTDIQGVCKQTRLHAQWRTLRQRMWKFKQDAMKSDERICTADFWSEFLNNPPPTPCEDVKELVEIFLVIVLSSVPCERSYSSMNSTKSKARSRMLTDLLNDLMMIKQNGPSIEGADDDVVRQLIDKAFAEWRRRKNRCPARSRTDERPERRKSSKDIMDEISMPRGRKVAKGTKECEMNDQDKGKGPALSN